MCIIIIIQNFSRLEVENLALYVHYVHFPGSTPPPPLEVTAAVTDSTTVQLSWIRPVPTDSVDSYIITWYPDDTPEDIEVMIVSGADSSATVPNLEPGQTYVFSIRSSNQYGFSETIQLEVTAEGGYGIYNYTIMYIIHY